MGEFGTPRKIKEKLIYKEKCKHDKNTIRLPWQELPFLLNFLILCRFLDGRRDFSTFERRSGMTIIC